MSAAIGIVILLVTNFFTQPAFFMGVFVFIGLLLIKKPWYEALAGFIKTAVGFFILQIGSNGLSNTFRPIVSAIGAKFGLEAAVIDTYFLTSQMVGPQGIYAMEGAIAWTMLAFVVSFAWNFLLVFMNKWTRCRTIYVTGHTLQTYTSMWLWFVFLLVPETRNMQFSLLFGLLAGTWAAVGSNMTVEATNKLTGGGLAIGHQNMWGIWFVDKIAPFLGGKNRDKKVEDIKLPGFLSIFNDNVVSTSVLMTVFLGTIMVIVGRDTLAAHDTTLGAGTLMPIYILTTCLHFTVYMYVLLAGVRMFISELMKAFDGISKRFIKGSIPAVDCAVSYNFAHPNVPLIGFVFGFVGQLIAIVGLLIFKSPLFLVPGFVPLFFDNATIAVYANAAGGRRAAILAPLFNGIFQVLISLAMILFVAAGSDVMLIAWPAFFDNNSFLSLFLLAAEYVNPTIVIVVFIVGLLLINQLYYRKNKEHYYDHMN